MHRSRLAGFIIDCEGEDLEGATHFWSQALGLPATGTADDDPGYRRLADGSALLHRAGQVRRQPGRREHLGVSEARKRCGQPRRNIAIANHVQAAMSNSPPTGVTRPSGRGAPASIR